MPVVLEEPAKTHQSPSAAGHDEATYSNPKFGLSFRIPNNFTLVQGQGAGARSMDFAIVPGDPGEYFFAKLESTAQGFPFPLLARSSAAVYFGVHLGISEEACLEPLSFVTYKSKGTVLLDGVTFHWSADPGPPENARFRPMRSPFGEEYFRDYAGFSNSVCYEFHLRVRTDLRENRLPELEAVLSTLKIFPRTIGVHVASGQPEIPFPVPDEILGLFKFAPWQISYPRIFGGFPALRLRQSPVEGDARPAEQLVPAGRPFPEMNAITLTYASGNLKDDEAVTAAITQLERQIIDYLEQHQWSRAHARGNAAGALQKGGAYLEIAKGTGRCTMNSPCTQFDSLTVTFYLPLHGDLAP